MQTGHRTKHSGQNVCEMADTVMFYYTLDLILVNVTFSHFQISCRSVPRTSRRSQGTEPRRQMPASAGLHCRGHCRRD
ncbi:unnamed protein product, partial [Staurois parvus]